MLDSWVCTKSSVLLAVSGPGRADGGGVFEEAGLAAAWRALRVTRDARLHGGWARLAPDGQRLGEATLQFGA